MKFHLVWIIILAIGLFPDFLIAQENFEPVTSVNVSELSLDEKVGQLLMIGFPQVDFDKKLQAHIQKIHASSFIFFKRNIEDFSQAAKLTQALNQFVYSVSKTSALIAIDQEGGAVARITTTPATPNAFSVGLTKNPEIAYELGQETGRILKQYGFNMNLAPVLDITDSQKNNFIGLRSFSSYFDITASLGFKYSQGLIDSKVLPTAKHFPGMASVFKDPHLGLVESPRSFDQIQKEDLFPYKKFIELGPNTAIMLSHLTYPSLDSTKAPALFSRKISTDILRNELKFTGLVVTDDIQMRSSQSVSTTWENAIKSLKAGADLIILSWSQQQQEKTFIEIKKAIENGSLSIAEIDAKVARILAVKKFFANPNISIPTEKRRIHPSNRLAEINQKILTYSIGSLLTEIKNIELKKSVCVYSPSVGDDHHVGRAHQTRDGRDVAYEVERQLFVQRRVDAVSRIHQQHGVAIRRCGHHRLGADVVAAARPVLHHHLLPETL